MSRCGSPFRRAGRAAVGAARAGGHARAGLVPSAVLFCLALLGLAALAHGAELRPASLIPQWEPQAQFAGYYVAQAKGFYKKYGLDMTILRGGPTAPPSELVKNGKALFGTFFLATALKLRSEGLPLVNLAQLVKRSSLLLMARASSGIMTPADLDGRRVSLWGAEFRIQPEAFFAKYGVRLTELPQGYTVNLFLRGGVDVVSGMWYNEYHSLLNSGLDENELTVFFMSDHGLNFPEDGLYCLASTLAADPDLARDVVAASLEGWRYAFAHPEEALDIVMSHVNAANLPTNRVHQRWMLNRLRDIMFPDGDETSFGALTRAEYEAVAKALTSAGVISDFPAYEDFHAPCRTHQAP